MKDSILIKTSFIPCSIVIFCALPVFFTDNPLTMISMTLFMFLILTGIFLIFGWIALCRRYESDKERLAAAKEHYEEMRKHMQQEQFRSMSEDL